MDSSLVYLVQTDTTVGFSSSNDEKLSLIKQRPTNQKILQTVDSFKTLKQNTRVPKEFRKRVRNSKKTTFIYPNTHSFRVISKDDRFFRFIHKFKSLYSTSRITSYNVCYTKLLRDCAASVERSYQPALKPNRRQPWLKPSY